MHMNRLHNAIACLLILVCPFLSGQTIAFLNTSDAALSPDQVTAFQVRADFDIDLDEQEGWAAALNIAPSQTVDTPFRIRFEVESDTSCCRRQYSLQYKWNDKPWTYVEAHEFPYESAASPTVSIVSCDAFFMGEEADNLITASKMPANPGAGISLAPTTPGWLPEPITGASAEWEFALVIRRWADGPELTRDGDQISLRMVDQLERPLKGQVPVFTVHVPKQHLGGTFVETPARIGPYENSKGELYFIMEPTETDNVFMMLKSADGGQAWFEVGEGSRPAISDLEGVGSVMSDDGIIHIVHQISEAVYYHAFATSDHSSTKDQWVVDSRLITTHEEPPTQTADITLRPDGSLLAVFAVGNNVQYSILHPGGEWTEAANLSPVLSGQQLAYTNPLVLSRPDGIVDVVYKSLDGKGWHRQLLPDNTLTPPQIFAYNLGTSEDENIAILPLVYLPEKETTIAVFRQSDGYLYGSKFFNNSWSEPIKVSDRKVVTGAVDSEQTGADVVAWNGQIFISFISAEDKDIYLSTLNDFKETPEAQLIVPNIEGSWVRGHILHHKKNVTVYGIVYDAGSKGGSGYNKYIAIGLKNK